eukprot:8552208-Pyramimonas_sp.AAC.1
MKAMFTAKSTEAQTWLDKAAQVRRDITERVAKKRRSANGGAVPQDAEAAPPPAEEAAVEQGAARISAA